MNPFDSYMLNKGTPRGDSRVKTLEASPDAPRLSDRFHRTPVGLRPEQLNGAVNLV